MAAFSELLREFREKAGYASPHEFFRKSGGAKVLGVSYDQYLNYEKGRSVPRPAAAVMLVRLLRLPEDARRLRAFVLGFLEAVLGSEAQRALVAPFLADEGGRAAGPMSRAVEKAMAPRRRNLSLSETQAVFSSPASYWIFNFLSDDAGDWDEKALTQALGLGAAETKSGLESLARAGLVRTARKGRYRCRWPGAIFIQPFTSRWDFASPQVQTDLAALWDGMEKKKGAQVFRRWVQFRASEKELSAYVPHLRQAVLGAEMYSSLESHPDSAQFVVEVRIRKMFAYPRR